MPVRCREKVENVITGLVILVLVTKVYSRRVDYLQVSKVFLLW